ncbi:MAG: deoxynucleoside kinase [Flavobacteriales bacterium TMED123]|nr:MAG: deoxynucleoside kinase [Flavobacteriales bacterium TMED123]|tara:strand:+ start:434 stop:1063 length:630 start_codon:yes stop_codon:yes gene_type:complete
MQYKFICIEGNIGVGKTSLAQRISADFNARLVLEEFANNPFLPKFYKEPSKYAFPLELFFMAERYKQIKAINEQELFTEFTVSDYYFVKSRLFAQNNLSTDELQLFYRLFDIMLSSLPKPDLLIYLYADIPTLQKNIKKRARTYEQDISDDYLLNIQEKYLDFFRKQNDFPVLILDISNANFVQNKSEYQKITDAFKKRYLAGIHRISL